MTEAFVTTDIIATAQIVDEEAQKMFLEGSRSYDIQEVKEATGKLIICIRKEDFSTSTDSDMCIQTPLDHLKILKISPTYVPSSTDK